jgi:hypothetical protein
MEVDEAPWGEINPNIRHWGLLRQAGGVRRPPFLAAGKGGEMPGLTGDPGLFVHKMCMEELIFVHFLCIFAVLFVHKM